MKNRGLLISLSIVIGIVLSCAILPLGGLAMILLKVEGNTSNEPLPAKRWQEQKISGSGKDFVLLINVSGIIGAEDEVGLLGNQLSHSGLLSQIQQATSDPLIKAIVLRVDSPGGGVVASNDIYNELKKLRAEGKKLVVSMGSIAASGGYYISAGADSIYANQDTITGSLGVIITSLNYQEALDKLGLRQVVYKSGKFKDILSPARDATPEEQKILNDFVDQAYQGFVNVIVEGRNLSREKVLQIADGRIYSGKQAQELKLIDKLGNQDDAIEEAKSLAGLSEATIVRYRANNSLSNILLSKLENQQQPTDPLGLRQLTHAQWPQLEYRMLP